MKSKMICVPLDYNFIQQLRFVDALSEADDRVAIPFLHARKFRELEKRLGCKIPVCDENYASGLSGIRISHSIPRTCIGSICRPLIFSHRFLSRLKQLWNSDRSNPVFFAGTITHERRNLIDNWCENASGHTLPINFPQAPKFGRISRWLLRKPIFNQVSFGPLTMSVSDRGRVAKYKAWDEFYFRSLSRSKFVLCPAGDFVWTYRFFEAVLCGAIPIVDKSCELYEGFEFERWDSKFGELTWSKSRAEKNYQHCFELLTVPSKLIKYQIDEQLQDKFIQGG